MKSKFIIILLILTLIPNTVFADYKVFTDNSIIVENTIVDTNFMVVPREVNGVRPHYVRQAIKELRFDVPFDYNVHIIDYWFFQELALGLALPTNDIVIFDFIDINMKEWTHDTVIHEIGHLVYNTLTTEEILEYKIIREIPEEWDDFPIYVNRTTEIFAEDFRLLFGGRTARIGRHFNQELTAPRKVEGLRSFMKSLENKGVD